MSEEPQGIASALPELDADQVEWAQHAAHLLARMGYQVDVLPNSGGDGGWYIGPALAFRPAPASRPATGSTGEALVDALVHHDDILSAIEESTGLAAEFKDHGAMDCATVRVVLQKEGDEIGEIIALAKPARPLPEIRLTPLTLAFSAARLSLEEAHQLSDGDLLLLSSGPWPLLSEMRSQAKGTLSLEPATGVISHAIQSPHMNAETAPMSDPADTGQMTVPVAIHLPDVALSEDELSRLAQRGSLDIGPVTEGLHAKVSVGGRSVGQGQIVRIGDRFALLLEEPVSSTEEAPASAEATDETEAGVEAQAEPAPSELQAEIE